MSSLRSYGNTLADLVERRLPIQTTADRPSSAFSEWAQALTLEGHPFSFDKFPWLRQIYEDDSPRIVAAKGRQLGFTMWAFLGSFHGLLMRYAGVVYLMPTKEDVASFVRARVDPIIADNHAMRTYAQSTDNVGLKRIRNGSLYFRGMRSRSALKSVPADRLVFDELDEFRDAGSKDERLASSSALSPANVRLAEKMLSASPYRHTIEISNPTLPNFGIDRSYQASDRMVWHLRCEGCAAWEAPDLWFPRELGRDVPCILERPGQPAQLVCHGCRRPIDPKVGRWIPAKPEAGRCRGYWLSQLNRPGVDLDAILDEYRTTDHPMEFYNGVLGLAYADSTNMLSRQQVLELCGREPMATRSILPTTMGVDVGGSPATDRGIFHVVIGRSGEGARRVYLWIGVVASFSELDDLIRRFNVGSFVVDAGPETDLLRTWILGRWPSRGWLCFYDVHRRGCAAWNEETREVSVNRTEALDASRAAIRDRELRLPSKAHPAVQDFAEHQQQTAKKLVDDGKGGKRYVYIKLSEDDHYAHALTYDTLLWRRARSGGVPSVRTEPERGSDGNLLTMRF